MGRGGRSGFRHVRELLKRRQRREPPVPAERRNSWYEHAAWRTCCTHVQVTCIIVEGLPSAAHGVRVMCGPYP